MNQSGILYIVATPIGHLDDFSQRARDVLEKVSVVYAEDTRHSQQLLNHYHIRTPTVSLHEHNESQRIPEVVGHLSEGRDAAIISDAGTPLINDPGYRLVAHCLDNGLQVSPIPGPCALVAALCAGGLPTDSFTFCGFPPARQSARLAWLRGLASEARTLVMFESRHRIVATLEDLVTEFGPKRQATVARELTKKFENIRKNSLQEHLDQVNQYENARRGEFVLVLQGVDAAAAELIDAEDEELVRVLRLLLRDLSVKAAAGTASEILGVKKNRAYKLALELESDPSD